MSPRGMNVVVVVAVAFTLLSVPVQAKKASKASSSGHNLERSMDDELMVLQIPSYECSGRSRDWTVRCLVPTTNYQLTVHLCGTKKTPDKKLIESCIRELYILSKSCTQPSMVEAAKEMLYNKEPPPPPPLSSRGASSRFTGKSRPSSLPIDTISGLPVMGNPSKKHKGGKRTKEKKQKKDLFDL